MAVVMTGEDIDRPTVVRKCYLLRTCSWLIARELGDIVDQMYQLRNGFLCRAIIRAVDNAAIVFFKLPFKGIVQRQWIIQQVT